MIGLILAAWLAASPTRAEKSAQTTQIHEDLNAVRRARYALRKAKSGTSEEESSMKALQDAKKKLKDDRLKARGKKK